MTVPADSAKDQVQTATTGLVNLRENGRWAGGSSMYAGEQLVTGWHFHDVHEIEYACHGVVEVRTQAGHYLLPPHQAAWIPAGLQHQTTLNADGRTLAVLFEPRLVPAAGDRVRIIAVSALLREMMLYSVRWPISRTESGAEADSFFQALGYVVADALDDEMPLNLPVPAGFAGSTGPMMTRHPKKPRRARTARIPAANSAGEAQSCSLRSAASALWSERQRASACE